MPRPIHFEIQAENTAARDRRSTAELFGWEFSQWGNEPYWLVKTGEKGNAGHRRRPDAAPRRPGRPAMAAVNAFVCTVDVADLRRDGQRSVAERGGTVALPKMPVPTVGWLAYGKDTEGNLFGMMQMDANAK